MLILPSSTYRAPEFLRAAEALSVEVVTASDERQALAEFMGDRFLELALNDTDGATERIVAFSSRAPLDAVVAVDDVGSLVAAASSERLGLITSGRAAVAATRNKIEMRHLLGVANVCQPRYGTASGVCAADFEDAVASVATELSFPVVIKPASLSGSRGVIRADNEAEVRSAARRLYEIARCAGIDKEPAVVEAFVPGDEVALEGLVTKGELATLAIFDKPDPLDGPFFEETIYVTPSVRPPEELRRISALVAAACRALGLSEGPVHAEVRLDRDHDGEPVLIEAASRTIGGKCAKALSFATGVTLEEIVLRAALGKERLDTPQESRASGVMMLPIERTGRLCSITGREKAQSVRGITGLEITVAPGTYLEALPEASRYLGFLFARGETSNEVTAALREAHGCLDVSIDAKPRDER